MVIVIDGQVFNVAKELRFSSMVKLSFFNPFGKKIEFETFEIESGNYIIGLNFLTRRGALFKKELDTEIKSVQVENIETGENSWFYYDSLVLPTGSLVEKHAFTFRETK